MTEQEWLALEHPGDRLLIRARLGCGGCWDSIRKGHLLVCACARRIWHLFQDERSRRAVEVAERVIEGAATLEEVCEVSRGAADVVLPSLTPDPGPVPRCWGHSQGLHLVGSDPDCPEDYAECYLSDAAAEAACKVIAFPFCCRWGLPTDPLDPMVDAVADWAKGREDPATREQTILAERRVQCALLLDIFGNPFRPVAFNASWRTPDVVTLAGHIYHDRAFAELPELAEALVSAGCAEPTVLAHCRESGPHVRGCFVVDLALAKE